MASKKEKKTEEKKGGVAPIKKTTRLAKREPSLWDPFGMMREMDRIFGDFRSSFEDLFAWPLLRSPDISRMMPTIPDYGFEFHDHPKEFLLASEAPGADKKDIKIDVTPEDIEICVESKGGEEGAHRHSSYCRYLTFPEEVIPDKAKARLKKGVLEITVPKKSPRQEPKKHKLKVE